MKAFRRPSDSPDADSAVRGPRSMGGKYRRRTKKEVRTRRTNNSYSTELVLFVQKNCSRHGTGGQMSVREIARLKNIKITWVAAVAAGIIRVNG